MAHNAYMNKEKVFIKPQIMVLLLIVCTCVSMEYVITSLAEIN